MRQVTHTPLPPIGPGTFPPETESLDAFVEAIPYFLSFDLIPPCIVMNQKFCSGDGDAGMSGGSTWEPFEITADEYDELVAVLIDKGFRYREAPDWVVGAEEWRVFQWEVEMGIPSDQHLPLAQEVSKWNALAEAARLRGDQEKWSEYLVKTSQANQKVLDLTEPYMDRYHGRT